MSDYKVILGILAALMSICAHVPYIVMLLRGTNRPHIFTWILWTLLTVIACAAQFTGGAGPGAWSTLVTVWMCLIITVLTLRQKGNTQITQSDWAMFTFGLSAIPIWVLTSDPLGAVIVVTIIDALAFGPTFRKSWNAPFQENITMYAVNVARHVVAVLALSQYSAVTALYPAMLFVMNATMLVMLVVRRRKLAAMPGS